MGKCGSKYRNPASDRLDSLADYDNYPAGSSGLGFGDFGFTGRKTYQSEILSYYISGTRGGVYGFESSCPQGVNQNTALLATAAAIAVGAGVIYRAVTLQQAGRRRRREASHGEEVRETIEGENSFVSRARDLIMMGRITFKDNF